MCTICLWVSGIIHISTIYGTNTDDCIYSDYQGEYPLYTDEKIGILAYI